MRKKETGFSFFETLVFLMLLILASDAILWNLINALLKLESKGSIKFSATDMPIVDMSATSLLTLLVLFVIVSTLVIYPLVYIGFKKILKIIVRDFTKEEEKLFHFNVSIILTVFLFIFGLLPLSLDIVFGSNDDQQVKFYFFVISLVVGPTLVHSLLKQLTFKKT